MTYPQTHSTLRGTITCEVLECLVVGREQITLEFLSGEGFGVSSDKYSVACLNH
jgi:hypothetical protein